VNSRFRGVLFDIDGTLVDSNDAHAHVWVKALAETNIRVE
jgi:beta-phosphoglucomutase-like phosphatase (HAD superfamily)